jgi:5'-3' exonuclease
VPVLLLLDSASLYYRSYYALPESMRAPDGYPHNAVRGFLSTLGKLIDRFQPTHLAACWDADWRPAWRVALMDSYKTHRLASGEPGTVAVEQEPPTLGPQAAAIAGILDAMGIARPGIEGYEADDVIASLAAQQPGPSVVVTGDRDLVQVIRDGVRVLLTVNGGMDAWPLLDAAGVQERFGVAPEQYVDFAVLRGDPSDGIPGVPGIGAKTAASLLASYRDLDRLLLAAAQPPDRPLTARICAGLTTNESAIRAARTVATAVTSLKVDVDLALPTVAVNPQALRDLAEEWGVGRFIPDLAATARSTGRPPLD